MGARKLESLLMLNMPSMTKSAWQVLGRVITGGCFPVLARLDSAHSHTGIGVNESEPAKLAVIALSKRRRADAEMALEVARCTRSAKKKAKKVMKAWERLDSLPRVSHTENANRSWGFHQWFSSFYM